MVQMITLDRSELLSTGSWLIRVKRRHRSTMKSCTMVQMMMERTGLMSSSGRDWMLRNYPGVSGCSQGPSDNRCSSKRREADALTARYTWGGKGTAHAGAGRDNEG